MPTALTDTAIRALVLYSLAEHQAGHARQIEVSIEGPRFSVSDDGRGHAIERTVAEMPYLRFIYTQFEYPFGSAQGGAVQLQGIGMSLLNSLCGDLQVSVRKPRRSLHLRFANGQLVDSRIEEHARSAPTGNAIAGAIHARLQLGDTAIEPLKAWLQELLTVHPGLRICLNGEALNAC